MVSVTSVIQKPMYVTGRDCFKKSLGQGIFCLNFKTILHGKKLSISPVRSPSSLVWASMGAQTVKNMPAMQEPWVQALDQKDPLQEGMETHSSILVWETPWAEEPGRLWFMESQRVGHDWVIESLWYYVRIPGSHSPKNSDEPGAELIKTFVIMWFSADPGIHCLCTQISHWAQLSTTRPHHPCTPSRFSKAVVFNTESWVLPLLFN